MRMKVFGKSFCSGCQVLPKSFCSRRKVFHDSFCSEIASTCNERCVLA